LLRDIERLTRLKIDVAPLPENFNETAETLKRLKPAPKKVEEQPRRFSHGFKADRRADGQRRDHRNERQRHPHRADGHPAHRSSAQDRNGQRRDDQRGDGSRSSYRPEAYREADAGPRPARPNRKFNGRRGRPGGPRRAQG
jgi:ATP-dependent RNA helicase RhlE